MAKEQLSRGRGPNIVYDFAIYLLFAFGLCGTLEAQVIGIGYQKVESDQADMREMRGPGLRLRLRPPIDLRYDYYTSQGQRIDSPCGGFIPPDCGPEVIDYSSYLHNFFVAGRIDALPGRSFHVFVLPEVGVVFGKISKRSAATGLQGASSTGGALGAGAAVELSTESLGKSPLGGWIAVRYRRFTTPGSAALDGYEPHRDLNWIRSAELGLILSF
jgi:hypothetical protein